jgi:hypothetical protein
MGSGIAESFMRGAKPPGCNNLRVTRTRHAIVQLGVISSKISVTGSNRLPSLASAKASRQLSATTLHVFSGEAKSSNHRSGQLD